MALRSFRCVPAMSSTWPPLTLLLFSFPLPFLFFQLRHTSESTRIWAQAVQSLSLSPTISTIRPSSRELLEHSVRDFCHTDAGLDVRTFHDGYMSTRNCIGECKHKDPKRATFLPHALEAPRISALCQSNPFHGFYDCIWPLAHYLTTCMPMQTFNATPIILVNNKVLSEKRRHKWVVKAQERYLYNSRPPETLIEKNRLPSHSCMCFRSVVKFKRSVFWRPTRFQYTQEFGNNTVVASHPNGAKRNGLLGFRRVVLESFGRDSSPRNAKFVLVYGREDSKRRKWVNAGEFAQRLRRELPGDVRVVYAQKTSKAFEEQVVEYNDAALVVAPHGAAMSNTLFMRENSAVLEIASKHCFPADEVGVKQERRLLDMDTVANVSDANAWVPWHAQSLGIYHMSAPCFTSNATLSEFLTDNESLVKLAVVMLMLPRKVDAR